MQIIQYLESTSSFRRLFLFLVDATDGITAVTGESGTVRLSRNGLADAESTNSIVEIDATNQPGRYYIELTQAEISSVGPLSYGYKTAATAQFYGTAQVVQWDIYDSVRLGLTALPQANASAVGGLYTRGTGAGQINQSANGRIDVDAFIPIGGIAPTNFSAAAMGSCYLGSRGPGIFLDENAANTNTALGVDGLAGNPVSTLAAAKSLAAALDYHRIYLVGATTFAIGASDVVSGYEFVGEINGQIGRATVTVASGAAAANAAFYDLIVGTSTFASSNQVRFVRCDITGDIQGSLKFEACRFLSNITVTIGGSSPTSELLNCSVSAGQTLTLDMDSPQCAMHAVGFRGNLVVSNMDHSATRALLDCYGSVTLNSSNVLGAVIVSGQCDLTDNSAGSTVVDVRVSNAVWEEQRGDHSSSGTLGEAALLAAYDGPHGPGVWVRTSPANTNTVPGVDGTATNTVSTIATAKTIAAALGLYVIYIHGSSGSFTIGESLTNFSIYGMGGPATNTVSFSGGATVDNCRFENVTLTGTISSSSDISLIRGILALVGVSVGRLYAYDCALKGNMSFTSLFEGSVMHQCFAQNQSSAISISIGSGTDLTVYGFSGDLAITGTLFLSNVLILDVNGRVTLNNTGGDITLYGQHELVDNGSGATITDRRGQLLIADSVWDEAKAGHVAAGSFGEEVQSHATQAEILSDATPFAGANIDATVSSRATPGDAMDLVTNAVDAAALATDAVNEIRDSILSDSTPFAGANVDVAVSSRSNHTPADTAAAVWDEARAAHVAAGSFGQGVASVQGSVTGDVNGNVDGSVGSLATGAITSASFAANAINAAVLATDALNAVADQVLSRPLSNVEAAAFRTLAGAIAKLVNKFQVTGTTLSIYKTDDSTVWGTQDITSDAGAEPITGLDTN